MEISQIITNKLEKYGITTELVDIEIALSEVDYSIKNYCYITNIPEELLFVRANLVVDYIRYVHGNRPSLNGGADVSDSKLGPLTSVKAGDVTYSFANNTNNKGAIENAHIADLDLILNNYTHQLNKFRRIKC